MNKKDAHTVLVNFHSWFLYSYKKDSKTETIGEFVDEYLNGDNGWDDE